MRAQSELGSIDPKATHKVFRSLDPTFDHCEETALRRVDVLSGDLNIFVRIGLDGKPKYAYLLESTVGDYETEKCFVDAVLQAKFPRPEGGDAEVKYQTNLKATPTRPATDWPSERVANIISRARTCKDGSSARYQVTLYVGPQGGKAGRVLSVGVAAAENGADERVSCIVRMVQAAHVPTPGSWPAKVTFEL